MPDETNIEIKFTGGEIKPEKIKARDLASVIMDFEDTLTEIVAHREPHIQKNDLVISLVGIESGSLELAFKPQFIQPAMDATLMIGVAIERQEYAPLPNRAIKSLQNLVGFTRRNNCEMEISICNGIKKVVAVLTPDTDIQPPLPLKGETVIYGTVMRVGGKKPRLMFQPVGLDHVKYSDVTRPLARQLATKLYQVVGLRGIAQWDAQTFELDELEVQEVIDYVPIPVSEAFEGLSNLIGKYYADIDDVEAYVANLRDKSPED